MPNDPHKASQTGKALKTPPDRDTYAAVLINRSFLPHCQYRIVAGYSKPPYVSRDLEFKGKRHSTIFLADRKQVAGAKLLGWVEITKEWFAQLDGVPEPEPAPKPAVVAAPVESVEQPEEEATPLDEMTTKELRALAKQHGIPSRQRKEELIEALKAVA